TTTKHRKARKKRQQLLKDVARPYGEVDQSFLLVADVIAGGDAQLLLFDQKPRMVIERVRQCVHRDDEHFAAGGAAEAGSEVFGSNGISRPTATGKRGHGSIPCIMFPQGG